MVPTASIKNKPDSKKEVVLSSVMEIINQHLTETLCEDTFRKHRTLERQRKWSLHALVRFWTAVIIRAPKALTGALEEADMGGNRFWPEVNASPEAFFGKCKYFDWGFFAALYAEFSRSILEEAPCVYGEKVASLRKDFPEIWAMDGSQLAKVAHRLKILWRVEGAVLPGRIFMFYDIFRGISREMVFEPDSAKNENLLAQKGLAVLPEGTLVIGDRLFGTCLYFRKLSERKCWGVLRRHRGTKYQIIKTLSSEQRGPELFEDSEVQINTGVGTKKQTLRLIVYSKGDFRLELFTNVLDPEKLSAEKAVELYSMRWSIERMFYDLKEVLNLNHFYAANPNAIAMQVFASAMVYNAFRIAQGRIAAEHKIQPELVSSAKLYPKLASASYYLAMTETIWHNTIELNSGIILRKPEFGRRLLATTTLGAILADKRIKTHVRARRKPKSIWLSWLKVPGGDKLLKEK